MAELNKLMYDSIFFRLKVEFMPIVITSSNICIQEEQILHITQRQNQIRSLKFHAVVANPPRKQQLPQLQNQWLYHQHQGWLRS